MTTRRQSPLLWLTKTWPIFFWEKCEKCGNESV